MECGKSDGEGEDGNRSDYQCGRDPAEREEEAGDASRRGGDEKDCVPMAEPAAGAERREGDEAACDADQTDDDVQGEEGLDGRSGIMVISCGPGRSGEGDGTAATLDGGY